MNLRRLIYRRQFSVITGGRVLQKWGHVFRAYELCIDTITCNFYNLLKSFVGNFNKQMFKN